MTHRTFASWVEPIAARLRENRAEVVAFARSLPAEAWGRPSPLEDWTCKDLLAHIGKANDQLFQKLLRTVIAREPVDTSMFATVDTDDENARAIEVRQGMSPEEVIAEVEAAGEEIQDLLSRLTEDDRKLRQEEPPFILEGFLQGVLRESHDLEHLAQLRTALEEP
jgi:uncharacterized protein (TIGR03083 family)